MNKEGFKKRVGESCNAHDHKGSYRTQKDSRVFRDVQKNQRNRENDGQKRLESNGMFHSNNGGGKDRLEGRWEGLTKSKERYLKNKPAYNKEIEENFRRQLKKIRDGW